LESIIAKEKGRRMMGIYVDNYDDCMKYVNSLPYVNNVDLEEMRKLADLLKADRKGELSKTQISDAISEVFGIDDIEVMAYDLPEYKSGIHKVSKLDKLKTVYLGCAIGHTAYYIEKIRECDGDIETGAKKLWEEEKVNVKKDLERLAEKMKKSKKVSFSAVKVEINKEDEE
jgi:hypothetical protein